MRISVKSDTKKMLKDLRKLNKKVIPRITVRAVNNSMNKVYTAAGRDIASHHQIKPKKVLVGVRGKGGRLIKYPAKTGKDPDAKIWLGLGRLIKIKSTEKQTLKRLEGESKTFEINNGRFRGRYVRHPLPSSRYSNGRKQTSTPNLPFKRVDSGAYGVKMGRTAGRMLKSAGARIGKAEFEKEFKRQAKMAIKRAS